ncbi:MAG: aldehyde ferredoxin oxidoreductase N-terminal domain-containing protein, partial [Syntrophales bacterium]
MNTYGFAGKILYVDLTDGVVEKTPMDMTLAEQFGGGIGLCIKLAYDMIPFKCDPFSPENIIVIGAGPTVGTNLPASSRVYGITKFPGSGRIGWCGGGGLMFGCMLKNAGYDHIVIKGRSKSPVYLKIVDDDVEICNASHLVGMGVAETYEVLQEDIDLRAGIISIGAAGENRVSFSMAFIDRLGTLGRGGFGAVMGDKNLKAIVVKGTRGIRVADQTKYMKLNNDLCNTIRGYPYLKEWQELGLIKSLAAVPREVYLEHKVRRIACVSCPIGDKDLMKFQDNGTETYICSSSAANLFMPLMYGFHDHYNAMKCIAMLDEYGMDMFEFFGLMSFAKTLYYKGIILLDKDQELFDTSSLSSMMYWAEKIAHREELGDI